MPELQAIPQSLLTARGRWLSNDSLRLAFIVGTALFFQSHAAIGDGEHVQLNLVDAALSAATLVWLKSAVLWRCIAPSYWSRERIFYNLSAENRRPRDLLQWINKTTGFSICPFGVFLRTCGTNCIATTKPQRVGWEIWSSFSGEWTCCYAAGGLVLRTTSAQQRGQTVDLVMTRSGVDSSFETKRLINSYDQHMQCGEHHLTNLWRTFEAGSGSSRLGCKHFINRHLWPGVFGLPNQVDWVFLVANDINDISV